jgi:competence protein ComEC
MFGPAIAFLLGDLVFQQHANLLPLATIIILPLFWLLIRQPLPGVLLLAWFASGYGWALSYAHLQSDDGFNKACLGDTVMAEGVVTGLPHREGQRLRFDFQIDHIRALNCLEPDQRFLVRVNWYEADRAILSGERWRLPLKLRQTRNFYNPGGFDYEASLLNRDIRYTGYIRDTPEQLDSASSRWLDSARLKLAQKIDQALPDTQFKGIIQALVVGDRNNITQEQWQTLRGSGTLHLMAISGLHIGMLGGIGYLMGAGLGRLWPRICLYVPAPVMGAIGALFCALCYSALAGFSLPTQRALVMLAAVMLGLITRRKVHPRTPLSLALFILLILNPFAVTQPGFWLSFIAVGLLMFALEKNSSESRPRQWSRAQGVLLIGLLPLNLLFFKGTPLVGPVANLIAIPWIGFTVLPASLSGSLLLALGVEQGGLFLRLAEWCLALIWPILEWLQGLPLSWLALPAPGTASLILAGMGLILILAPSGWPGRTLGGVFLLPLFLSHTPRPAADAFWVDMLDVGEGLAIVVHTRQHTLLYDTGPRFSPRFDTGSAVVLPYLYQHKVNQIDTLIISHGDNDHIGGADSLMKSIPVQRLLSSVPEQLNDRAEYCREGQSWRWDGVEFRLLHPAEHWPYEGNNGSCVLKISNQHHSLLLTGDIESISEFRLRKEQGATLRSDILVIPHHGSLTSSTPAFIQAVAPRLALVSTGYQNRFGFPKLEVLGRYAEQGIRVLNTADYGAIRIQLPANDQAPGVEAYLNRYRSYWHSAEKPPT